ncbi:MAG: hypothetical protein NZ455_02430 [Bacteroidia bacterium]|nr:hypothetical protein [Bacteroidia bacterium]
MRRACVSTVRSVAKHRSDSAARSTPTRSAAKGHAQKINKDSSNYYLLSMFYLMYMN